MYECVSFFGMALAVLAYLDGISVCILLVLRCVFKEHVYLKDVYVFVELLEGCGQACMCTYLSGKVCNVLCLR